MAEKANLAKSDFLSSMSHELRTPLSAILGFAQLIESGTPPPTPAQKRSIDQILKAGWYLLDLINEILDLALIESGKLSLSLEPVSLAEVHARMRDHDRAAGPEARHQRGFYADTDAPCFVKADRTRLKQVLINLLSNAIKYNRPGGTVAVDVVGTPTGRGSDQRPRHRRGLVAGQAGAALPALQPSGQEATGEEGTGIGLVVSKRLVELMGGAIGVESTVGEGSVFWFELKLTAHLQPDPGVRVASVRIDARPRNLAERTPPLQTLLYVEDNPANLMLVEDLIARRPDIRLLSARDGVRGIEHGACDAAGCDPDGHQPARHQRPRGA